MPEGFTSRDELSSWLQKIKPDYKTIRRRYLRICLISAIIICVLETVMFFVYSADPEAYGGWKTSIPEYLLFYNILPTVIDFGAVLIAWIVQKKAKNEFIQNYAPIAAMALICTVAASAHSLYSITLSLLCLPIFMVSIFGVKSFNNATVILCALGLTAALYCRTLNVYIVNDMAFLPEALAGYSILFVAALLTKVPTELLATQKERLLMAARDAEIAKLSADEANRAKSDFLANMSHEIRTPLNAIIGMTEVLSRKTREPETREYAGDILQAGNALLAIIGDIIDISKIEAGKMELQENDYELGSLINDSYNIIAVRVRDKNLKAKVICDENLPRLLRGDEYHLRQVIVNLLSNAVKYTEEGTITLKVSGDDDGDILQLEVIVADTGIGIRNEDIDKLFSKFTRLDDVRHRRIEGVGLGLSITKQLVELMGGTISVSSVYGIGSSFTVRVPQKIIDRTPIGDIHATYMNVHGQIADYHKGFEAPDARILVVDDVKNNLQVICRLLEETKVSIDTASSGRECLELVAENEYDIILMDHMMPELDGIETLEIMSQMDNSKNKNTPVIMLTANAMVDARENYLNAGFVDYLAKPIHGARLERTILRFLPEGKYEVLENSILQDDEGALEKNPLLIEEELKAAEESKAVEVSSSESAAVEKDSGSVSIASDEAPETSDDLLEGGPEDGEPPVDKSPVGESLVDDTNGDEPKEFTLDELKRALPEIDADTGLSYCANDLGFYRSMLEDFASCGRDAEMEGFREAEDWDSYRISMHSLKSLARTIGLNEFADECQSLEDAARETNIDYINSHHENLISQFRETAEILESL